MPLRHDLTYAVRMLRRSPLTSAAAVLSLALGIGGTTAVFSVVDTVLLRPLPYADADRLVSMRATSRLGQHSVAPGDFVDFRRESRSFEQLAAVLNASVSLTGGGAPEQVRMQSVSGNFFPMLGARASLGRLFDAADDAGPFDRIVLSDTLWRNRFGASRDVIGTSVSVGGVAVEIVGVAAPGFKFGRPADLWLLGYQGVPRAGSVPGDLTRNRDVRILDVVGKLAPGVPLRAAEAELQEHAARIASAFPSTNAGISVALEPLKTTVVGETKTTLLLLLGAIATLLVIAAVNVANLMLVRASQRRGELALRSALGASAAQVVRLILVEAAAIAAFGGAAGIVAAGWGIKMLVALAPATLPRLDEVAIDGRILASGLLVTMGTAALFGVWPAWRAARLNAASALGGAGRSAAAPERRRVQFVLIGSEMSLALVLLVTAGLLAASFARLTAVKPGLNTEDVVTLDVSLPRAKYGVDPAAKAQFHQAVLDGIAAIPGVQAAAMSLTAPLTGGINRGVWIEGRPPLAPGVRQTMSFATISPEYFRMLGVPLRGGRTFTTSDSASSERVVVVNEAFVRRYLADGDPLARRIGFGDPASPTYWRRVVGIVGDVRERIGEPAPPTAYAPFNQDGEPWNFASYSVKSALPATAIASRVQAAVLAVDRDQPVSRVRRLDEAIAQGVAVERFTTLLAALFAAGSLLLAAIGAFGVISHVVASRRRELGVRLAIGARPADIVRLVGLEMLRVLVPAAAIGLAGAFAAGRGIASLLYQTRPADAGVMLAGVAVLTLATVAATYLPIRRALAANPLSSLREG